MKTGAALRDAHMRKEYDFSHAKRGGVFFPPAAQ